MHRRFVALLLVLLALLGVGTTKAWAQEPGLRAPPAETPDTAPIRTIPRDLAELGAGPLPPLPSGFERRDSGWLSVAYPSSVRERVEPLLHSADEMKAKLAADLGQAVLPRLEVRVARTPEEMAKLAPADAPPPAYASGVAYRGMHLVLLTLQSPGTFEAPDLDEVFRHELTHVALEDATLGHHVPLWFNEGFAVYESGESSLKRAKTLWDATLSKTLLGLADLDRHFPQDPFDVNIAYAESADFVRFLFRAADHDLFASLVDRVRGGTPFDRALSDAYGADMRTLEFKWKEELSKRYTFLPVLTGGTILWVGIIALMGVGWVKRRRRAKAKLDEWEREERAMDEAVAAAKARAAAAEAALLEDATVLRSASTKVPMIEHEGDWHTLH